MDFLSFSWGRGRGGLSLILGCDWGWEPLRSGKDLKDSFVASSCNCHASIIEFWLYSLSFSFTFFAIPGVLDVTADPVVFALDSGAPKAIFGPSVDSAMWFPLPLVLAVALVASRIWGRLSCVRRANPDFSTNTGKSFRRCFLLWILPFDSEPAGINENVRLLKWNFRGCGFGFEGEDILWFGWEAFGGVDGCKATIGASFRWSSETYWASFRWLETDRKLEKLFIVLSSVKKVDRTMGMPLLWRETELGVGKEASPSINGLWLSILDQEKPDRILFCSISRIQAIRPRSRESWMRGYVQSVSTGSSSRRLLIVIRSGGLAIIV